MRRAAPAKILVVEAHDMLQAVLGRALERAGYEVIPVAEASDVTALLPTNRPDLIVLDLRPEEAEARSLLASLKADAATDGIPVIAWSDQYEDSDRAMVLELGAEEYVGKGPPSELIPRIERLLATRR